MTAILQSICRLGQIGNRHAVTSAYAFGQTCFSMQLIDSGCQIMSFSFNISALVECIFLANLPRACDSACKCSRIKPGRSHWHQKKICSIMHSCVHPYASGAQHPSILRASKVTWRPVQSEDIKTLCSMQACLMRVLDLLMLSVRGPSCGTVPICESYVTEHQCANEVASFCRRGSLAHFESSKILVAIHERTWPRS